jgi:hypothetical protein
MEEGRKEGKKMKEGRRKMKDTGRKMKEGRGRKRGKGKKMNDEGMMLKEGR